MIPASLLWNSIQFTCVSAIAILISLACRGKYPQATCTILVGTMLGSLLLALTVFIPQSQWTFAIHEPKQIAGSRWNPMPDNQAAKQSFRDSGSETRASANDLNTSVPTESIVSVPIAQEWRIWLGKSFHWIDHRVQSIGTQPACNAYPFLLWTRLALLAMGIAGIASWCIGYLWMVQVLRSSRPIDDVRVTSVVEEFCKTLGIQRVPTVYQTHAIHIGATVGYWRCKLLLNEDWASWKPGELQAVVAHELAHIARVDYFWSMLSSLFRLIYFFHPLAYYMVRRMRFEQELAADQIAAGLVGNAKAYGRALAGLAIRGHDRRWASSPVLMASNFDLLRRITMLKQGRLKPTFFRGRTTKLLLLASALAVIPFSGLRSTPPENETPNTPDKKGTVEISDSRSRKELSDKQRELNEKLPPLKFTGVTMYHPGQFDPVSVSPTACWLSAYTNTMLFDKPPVADCELFGAAFLNMSWSDLKKEHGDSSFGCSLTQANKLAPGEATNLILGPQNGLRHLVVSEEVIDGHKVKGYGIESLNESGESVAPKQVSAWVVDDETGSFKGDTLDEVREYLKNPESFVVSRKKADFEDCRDAVCAVVFKNCQDWHSAYRKHIQGSPNAVQLNLVTPLLGGLTTLQATIKADSTDKFVLRAQYKDAQRATTAKEIITNLLEMAVASQSASPNSDASLTSVLESISIEQQDNELVVPLDIKLLDASLAEEYRAFEKKTSISGWSSLFSYGFAEHADGVVLPASKEKRWTTPRLVQNVDATPYRGKRVRFSVDATLSKEDVAKGRLELWTSGARSKAIGYASGSLAGNGIEFDVAKDATVLSFGLVAKEFSSDLIVKSCSFEVVGPAQGKVGEQPPFAVNLFAMPGCKIHASPVNLGFQSTKGDSPDQVAERPSESIVR